MLTTSDRQPADKQLFALLESVSPSATDCFTYEQ